MPRINRGGRRWTARSGTPGAAGETVRILGIDPGSQATGFGIVDWRDGDASYVASGASRTRGAAFAPRLRQIFDGVLELVREYRPAEVAIERVFMHRNADSALKLGQARGAAICAVYSGAAILYEYAPREVKLAVVGQGVNVLLLELYLDAQLLQAPLHEFAGEGLLKTNLGMGVEGVANGGEVHGNRLPPSRSG